jgi:tripartite-type tricarboxylate transporter receptor subunit TctC
MIELPIVIKKILYFHWSLPVLILGLLATFSVHTAKADNYPNRVVRIIVPYPPGGSAEIQARLIGQKLSEIWKQSVIIDNKPGAGTTLGAGYVAKSAPDGYTLYLASTSHTVSASLYKNLSYDAIKSFTPLSLIGSSPFVLTVRPDQNINTLKEFVDLVRANSGKFSYATSGIGAGPHLSGELLKSIAGIDMIHIAFKGTAPAMTALVGSQVDFLMGDVSIDSLVKAAKLKAIAITTSKRSPLFENVPTIAESGYPNYETTNWSGIIAPAGLPPELTKFINASIQSAMSSPELRNKFLSQGIDPLQTTPEEFENFLTKEVTKYAKVVKEADIRIDQ